MAGGALERQGGCLRAVLHQPGLQLPHPGCLPALPPPPDPPAASLSGLLQPPLPPLSSAQFHQLAGRGLDPPHHRPQPPTGDQTHWAAAARDGLGLSQLRALSGS